MTVVETIGRKASLDLRVNKWVNSEQAENWDLNMSSPQVVDWRKCVICQKETAEKSQCPANSKRHDPGAGYLTIERDLTSFHEAGELHLAVDWESLDEGNGISHTFENHRAT